MATSAGKAIGILARDRGKAYGIIILDHDLKRRCATDAGSLLSRQDVVDAIICSISRAVPVLVYSLNASHGPVMVQRLQKAGYDVTQIPMDRHTNEAFSQWIRAAQDGWASGLVVSTNRDQVPRQSPLNLQRTNDSALGNGRKD